jgi:hypothetical protein
VVTTPNGAAPHNWRFPTYDAATMEREERLEMASGLGARDTHLLNFTMPSLLALVRRTGFEVFNHRFMESYAINPIGFHRLLSLASIRRLDDTLTAVPGLRRMISLRLGVAARRID